LRRECRSAKGDRVGYRRSRDERGETLLRQFKERRRLLRIESTLRKGRLRFAILISPSQRTKPGIAPQIILEIRKTMDEMGFIKSKHEVPPKAPAKPV
jgi:hypothetical protein